MTKKIPTLFVRDEKFKVTPEVKAECRWVIGGEGIATEKLDGTNVRPTVRAGRVIHVEKRRNPTKEEKAQGLDPGYVDAHREDPQDKHIFKAVDSTDVSAWSDGQHECEAVGPKIQGNPLGLETPRCYPFKLGPTLLPDAPRTFAEIKEYLRNLDSRYSPSHLAEGIVFHHPDGRMAKIKRKDFDYESTGLQKPDLSKPAFTLMPDVKKAVEQDRCPTCGSPIREEDFRDELSRKEYGVSGMCQRCQDSVFGGGDRMNEQEIIESIKKIDKMIDRINELTDKFNKGEEINPRELRGYKIKYDLWILGAKLEGLTSQEYVDNYHLVGKNNGQESEGGGGG